MYRQGDVLLIPIGSIPEGMKSDQPEKVILAYGEVTGHHHRFEGGAVTAFFKEGDAEPMAGGTALVGEPTQVEAITVPEGGADLVHEEHNPISVAPGNYKIVRQREYVAPEIQRRVID